MDKGNRHSTPAKGAGYTSSLALAALGGLLLMGGGSAFGQVAGSVPQQQFQPTQGGPGGFNHLYSPTTPGHLQPVFGLWANQAVRPLTLVNKGSGEAIDLVRAHTQLDVLVGLGIGERFQLGVALPVTPFITEGPDGFFETPDIGGFGLGDLRIGGSWHILGDGTGFDLGLAGLLSLPTGDETRYLGNTGLTVEPRLMAALHPMEALTLGANLGFVLRPDEDVLSASNVPLITVGNEVVYGLGAVYGMSSDLDLIGEAYGRVGIGDATDGSNIPLEVDLSARKWVGDGSHALTFGVGTGLIAGYGSPNLRILAGYAFAPAPKVDTDGDGLFDDDDTCPTEAEDMDGFADEDGCPDLDNDGDGIPDTGDRCPDKAEDMDDFEDKDGCPDPDNDGDGIMDGADNCPEQAEDMDSFEDDDGCPDLDNDRDGFTDSEDACPNEAEVINGVDDEDGCPDEGESAVEVTDTHIRILQKVFFKTGSAEIQTKSFNLLNQVALTLRANPDLTLIEVGGHTDDTGKAQANQDLSQRRADSVKAYLVERGTAPERLQSKGYGEDVPLKKGKTRAARAANRRVEFKILTVNGAPAAEAPHSEPIIPPAATPKSGDMKAPPQVKVPMDGAASAPSTTQDQPRFSGETGEFKVIVYFSEGSAELTERGQRLCKDTAAWMNQAPKVRVKLQSFTDDVGDASGELAISKARGESVKACLVGEGVAPKRVIVNAQGSKWPKAEGDSPSARAQNRRVRILPINGSGKALKALPIELKVDDPSF